METRRIFDILDNFKEKYPDKTDVLGYKKDGKWITFSTQDYINYATNLSYGLLELGLNMGDKIATISNNRPEWNFVDMGMSQTGIIHVPIYPTISIDEYKYILNHAEPKLVFIADKMLYKKLKPIIEDISCIQYVFTFDKVEGAPNWKEITEKGKNTVQKYADKLKKIKKSINPEDIATLIYTSGTTGFPKGVMLSHHNLVSNFLTMRKIHSLDHNCRVLSFLPLCHVYERTVNYHFQHAGMSIYYAENMGSIAENAREIKPHIFNSVPRLLERIYDRIISIGKDLPFFKKQIFFWAVNLGLKYKLNNANGWWYLTRLKMANKLIFKKWRDALGGEIQVIVSGGAALQPRLARIFWAAGISVLEGYGLTETAPLIAVNNLNTMEIKFGTVGPVIDNVKVKIAEDGEILCKGPNVMVGYYKNKEQTKEVIDEDGWFHTGDIGVIEDNKFLKITDRKKEIFKLSSGKYVAPQVIENKFKESFFIEQLMVVGENEKFASALISPHFPFLHNWCTLHHVKFRDNNELIKNPQVVERYQKEVNEMNQQLGQTEHIKRFRLVAEEWSPQTRELSPTLKLKRRVISEKYKDVLQEIYAVQKNEKLEEKE